MHGYERPVTNRHSTQNLKIEEHVHSVQSSTHRVACSSAELGARTTLTGSREFQANPHNPTHASTYKPICSEPSAEAMIAHWKKYTSCILSKAGSTPCRNHAWQEACLAESTACRKQHALKEALCCLAIHGKPQGPGCRLLQPLLLLARHHCPTCLAHNSLPSLLRSSEPCIPSHSSLLVQQAAAAAASAIA